MSFDSKDDAPGGVHVDYADPSTEIDPALDAAVRRKLDWRLMPVLTLIYLFAFIDR
jgi:hypothetical protein